MHSTIATLGVMVAGVAAQAKFAADGYVYFGCVEAPIDGTVFSYSPSIDLVNADSCQAACPAGTTLVVVGPECHCVHPEQPSHFDFTRVKEEQCNNSCGNGEQAPWCGGVPKHDGQDIAVIQYNVYVAIGQRPVSQTPTPVTRPSPVPTPNNSTAGHCTGRCCYFDCDEPGSGPGSSSDKECTAGTCGEENGFVVSAGFKRLSGSVMLVVTASVTGLILVGI